MVSASPASFSVHPLLLVPLTPPPELLASNVGMWEVQRFFVGG